ncbi:MAG TPA: VOC family protein [Thermomicrobiales bacterium]|nr:VOC family protein [Thermomicrobiales bacterium]
MPSMIDHIVIISDDLDTAIASAREAGFTVVPGGTHGDGNTHNALIGFADGAYIELIAPTEQGRSAEHRWFNRLRNGGGMVDFCLLGEDLDTEIEGVRQRGIGYPEPFDMAREKPDGTRIAWKLSTPPGAVGERGWPFMIEDTTPRDLRVPQEPEKVNHPNGATGVAGITVLVRDLQTSTREYEAILGTTAQDLRSPFDDRQLGAILPLGPHWILLTEPGSNEATEHLERHGKGPYRLTLRTHDGPISPGSGTPLDAALFSGARIALA